MPTARKKDKVAKKKIAPSIPPDVFDDNKGVKVFIPDEELKEENLKLKTENEKEQEEKSEKDAGGKVLNEAEGGEVIEFKDTDKAEPKDEEEKVSEDKIEVSVKIEKSHETGEKNDEDEKDLSNPDKRSDEVEKENEKEKDDQEEDPSEQPSFYEKVLGEKPPEKSSDDPDEEEEQREGLNRSLFFLGGIVFVMTIVIATGVGLILLNKSNILPKVNIAIQPTQVPIKSPTPTPAEFKKSDISVEVLNGSGISGAAGKAGDKIGKLGYTVGNVDNADSSDHTGVEVGFASTTKDEAKKMILADLKGEFSDVTENHDLAPDGSADVLVIIGK